MTEPLTQDQNSTVVDFLSAVNSKKFSTAREVLDHLRSLPTTEKYEVSVSLAAKLVQASTHLDEVAEQGAGRR